MFHMAEDAWVVVQSFPVNGHVAPQAVFRPRISHSNNTSVGRHLQRCALPQRFFPMTAPFPTHLFIATPRGALALNNENAAIPLPQDHHSGLPPLRYGPYLKALSSCLSQEGYRPLLDALHVLLQTPVERSQVNRLDIISEKHGALYHVVHLKVQVGKQTVSFGLNVAASPEQKAFLESDHSILHELQSTHRLPHLPRVFFKGEAHYREEAGKPIPLSFFMVEWFEGYSEFHLSRPDREEMPRIRVWEENAQEVWLTPGQTAALYRGAAAILTAYLDTHTFRQIYPWHHAAGDFIIQRKGDSVSVKLITARDYRCLTPEALSSGDQWIGIVCFFINLTLRMRLDRLDGTGDLAWAHSSCLRPVVEGFLTAWRDRHHHDPSLPSPEEAADVLGSFDPDEWWSLAEFILERGMVEEEEMPFVRARLREHVEELAGAVAAASSH